MTEQTVESLADDIRDLRRRMETQAKQIATLIGFTGTLIGALESKQVLQPDDVQVLVEIFQRIAPDARNRAAQSVLKAVVIAAEETPQMMVADAGLQMPTHLGPLHASHEG